MAGNYPFHGKLHRSTHHTTPTPGIIESGSDPVAGPSSKFQGIFFTQNEGSSSDWYSAYTTLNANSAYWVSVYTTVYANSADWESVYSTTNTNSAYWSEAYTNLVNNSSAYLSAGTASGTASGVNFNPITTTDYFSGRITPLTLPNTNVQGALSALHDRLNGLYALLNGLTATNSTLFVSICSTL